MKILKFNENEQNIFIYYKLYGGQYATIDNIFKDLNKFDKLKIKYDIFLITNDGDRVGIFSRVPGNLPTLNIPSGYALSNIYDTIDKIELLKKDNEKLVTKEDLRITIDTNKFNI